MKLFMMMFFVVGAVMSNQAFADTVTDCNKIVQEGPVKPVPGAKAPVRVLPPADAAKTRIASD